MTQEYIGFSRSYRKLFHKVFPTIRRYDKYPEEGVLSVRTSNGAFDALILVKVERELKDIPTSLLCYDTGSTTRNEAINELNSFYQKPLSSDETVTVLFLQKLPGGRL